ncbi:nitrogenase component 1 [Candidatus Contubernalis alkaliaceticus]|uniref:nitrogenase component 1 n=1 Tax=Candidatus Contubernalis alkaliaceticus TaxID=338645 RepID=UPI001F4BEBC6|nr:nitrogenase component 1 [Candidatus Contubernalis alkalaceticus]UNC93075.1 oxalate:formate antiporter [Candidatus Contubernalis alkalaceticus]
MQQLYKYFPLPSDRMGVLWTLAPIKDACILEYGPAGTTHYAVEGLMQLNTELKARLYTTHIDENDIIMGDSSRLKVTIKEIDQQYKPPVIFVLASTISSVVGIDILSICQDFQPEVSAKLICFTGGGFRGDYTHGIQEVLTILAEKIVKEPQEKIKGTYNIIGSNIDCFNFASDIQEIQNIMSEGFGCTLHTVFSAKTSVTEIEEASKAEFNLVIRSEGIDCAKILASKFRIPYAAGAPYGVHGTYKWIKTIESAFSIKANDIFFARQAEKAQKNLFKFNHAAFIYENLTGILSGNLDFVLDILPLLRNEMMLDIKKIFVNHKDYGMGRKIPEQLKEKVLFNCDEEEKNQMIKEANPSLLVGDGVLLELGAHIPMQVQVANPNINHVIKIYEHTPFMGFNGAIYLTEVLLNQLQANRKKLQART